MSTTYPCDTCGSESATSDYCDVCGAAIDGRPAPAAGAASSAGVPPAPGSSAGPPPAAGSSAGSALPPPADLTSVSAGQASAGSPSADTCYFCGAPRQTNDVFCEVCGLDFVSGRMPTAPTPSSTPAGGTPSVAGAGAEAAPTTVGGAPSGWTAVVGADRAFFDGNVTAGVVTFPDAVGPRDIPLSGDEVSIGRRSESKGYYPDIDLSSPVDDPAVSRRHAALQRQADGSWAVLDVGSTNGTWLNDEDDPLAQGVLRALHDGDRLLLGAFTSITIRLDQPPPTP